MNITHAIAATLLYCAITASAQQIQISKENKTIAISTSDEASALADTAVVSVGFTSYGKDQDSTYADATRTSNAIIAALSASGVPKDAIASNEQRLSPLSPNTDEDKIRYGQGLRFAFSQGWQVTVTAAQAADVLHLAIINGANNSGNIQWQLKKDDALQVEAARKALEHARDIASHMAQGLGTKLGGLVYASNQTPQREIFASMALQSVEVNASVAGRMRNLKPLAISPDRITKSATVYAVFAIE